MIEVHAQYMLVQMLLGSVAFLRERGVYARPIFNKFIYCPLYIHDDSASLLLNVYARTICVFFEGLLKVIKR